MTQNKLEQPIEAFVFASAVTWALFAFFEIMVPYTEHRERMIKKCEDRGGFIYEQQNQETVCIKKDIIVIDLNK